MSGYDVRDDSGVEQLVSLEQLLSGDGRPREVRLSVAPGDAVFADPEKLRALAGKLTLFAAWLQGGAESGSPDPHGPRSTDRADRLQWAGAALLGVLDRSGVELTPPQRTAVDAAVRVLCADYDDHGGAE